jgi:hypothetical protein
MKVLISGARKPVRRALLQYGIRRPVARFMPRLEDAVAAAREKARGMLSA